VNPIISWTEDDVWRFIHERGIPYCSLYDEGFTRLGCIGCPMARKAGKEREFARWPRYERKWKEAFRKLWERRMTTHPLQRDGRPWPIAAKFENWEGMWAWWMGEAPWPGDDDDCDGLPLD
jgi:phosphoadenosine phosphosulfate reductase